MSEAITRPTLLMQIRDTEDARSWRQFVELYTPLIMRFCRWRGLGDHDAADVVQDVLASIAKAIKTFEYDPKKGTFRSWLFTITRRAIWRQTGKKQRQPIPSGGQTVVAMLDATQEAEEDDTWDLEYRKRLFQWAADSVRPEFQTSSWDAFWKTTVEECRGTEVADQLGLTVGAVYVAKSRVLKRIREKVASVADEWDLRFATVVE